MMASIARLHYWKAQLYTSHHCIAWPTYSNCTPFKHVVGVLLLSPRLTASQWLAPKWPLEAAVLRERCNVLVVDLRSESRLARFCNGLLLVIRGGPQLEVPCFEGV